VLSNRDILCQKEYPILPRRGHDMVCLTLKTERRIYPQSYPGHFRPLLRTALGPVRQKRAATLPILAFGSKGYQKVRLSHPAQKLFPCCYCSCPAGEHGALIGLPVPTSPCAVRRHEARTSIPQCWSSQLGDRIDLAYIQLSWPRQQVGCLHVKLALPLWLPTQRLSRLSSPLRR
jgi:hypothetical protein